VALDAGDEVKPHRRTARVRIFDLRRTEPKFFNDYVDAGGAQSKTSL
jgi:hypothetical protein